MKGRTIVDDDVMFGKTGLGIVPTVFAAKDPDLIAATLKLHVSFMYQSFTRHNRYRIPFHLLSSNYISYIER